MNCTVCQQEYVLCTVCPDVKVNPHCNYCGGIQPSSPIYLSRGVESKKKDTKMTDLSQMVADATDKLGELEGAEETLAGALDALRDFIDRLEEAQSALDDIDGYSVQVNVGEIDVDFTFNV